MPDSEDEKEDHIKGAENVEGEKSPERRLSKLKADEDLS